MVARIKSGKSIRGILHYNEEKVVNNQASIILASGFATDIEKLNFHQKLYRFEQLTQLNTRSKTNAMHISLNFHENDLLNTTKLQQIAADYMERLSLSDQPYIVYRHLDAAHPHLHIATVLIDKEGQRLKTEGIGKKLSEPARQAIEVQYGLVKAQGRRLKNEPYLRPAEYGAKPTKRQLNNITKAVMNDYAYTSFTEYKAVLAQFNVHVERGAEDSVMFKKKGLLYSITDQQGNPIGVHLKASAFYDGATMKNLEKRFEQNKERRMNKREFLVRSIERVLHQYEQLTMTTFQKELAAQQVTVVFRQNEKGLVYGLTFIDHRHRTVFNGSELGRSYSARALMERLSGRDRPKVFLSREKAGGWEKGAELFVQHAKEDSLLDGLLAKTDFDPVGSISRGRKKKKGKPRDQNLGI